jgi:hypothetical protein
MAQPRDVQSATASLVLSAIIRGEHLFAARRASIASDLAGKVTATG